MSEDAPFRTTDTVDAEEALTTLEAKKPIPLLFRVAFFGLAPYQAEDGEPVAPAPLRAQAEALGFRYTGRYSHPGILYGRIPREEWIDATGTIVLDLRRGSAETEGRLEQMMSVFVLQTFFDDGSTLSTYARDKNLPPSHELAERHGGTGFLEQDFEAHRAAVRADGRGRKALVFGDIETTFRAAVFQDSHVTTDAAPSFLAVRVAKVLVAVVVAYVLSRLI